MKDTVSDRVASLFAEIGLDPDAADTPSDLVIEHFDNWTGTAPATGGLAAMTITVAALPEAA
ncbi:hypothetical protein G3I59_27010 [Amycolatopsis rubida]|uniref:Uncharacterized protein n=1 Tax=Amycolatopsis rubida TaxID=112413 RepID=A0ABX0BUC5_9PSEU|nr:MULTISPECIES: hypothetical protein [Amycolatopsis]MYW94162.1 hypothetical protein [Amycolatopsis rubida]NEC59151.1 hypothetical protein [Amycolatopsis rubida]OAP20923.1 hypothetical protein A4R44_08369 [Amycolatopsis sp. M39]